MKRSNGIRLARFVTGDFSLFCFSLSYYEKLNTKKIGISFYNVTVGQVRFFHPLAWSDRIPLKLPKLEINANTIKREYTMKFLSVLLDENLSWKAHIDTIGKKISKNLGILYKARITLNQKSTKQLYFSFIHSYLTYGSMAWASTNKTKLNNLQCIKNMPLE